MITLIGCGHHRGQSGQGGGARRPDYKGLRRFRCLCHICHHITRLKRQEHTNWVLVRFSDIFLFTEKPLYASQRRLFFDQHDGLCLTRFPSAPGTQSSPPDLNIINTILSLTQMLVPSHFHLNFLFMQFLLRICVAICSLFSSQDAFDSFRNKFVQQNCHRDEQIRWILDKYNVGDPNTNTNTERNTNLVIR